MLFCKKFVLLSQVHNVLAVTVETAHNDYCSSLPHSVPNFVTRMI